MKITKDDIGREVRLKNGDTVIITEVGDEHSYPVISSDVVAYTVNGRVYTSEESELDMIKFVDTPETSSKISMDKTYQTRDGKSVRILCTDREGTDYPIVGLVNNGVFEMVAHFTSEGLGIEGEVSQGDLMEVIPRIKRTMWVNVYEDRTIVGYNSKADAKAVASDLCLAIIPIEINCKKGEGL